MIRKIFTAFAALALVACASTSSEPTFPPGQALYVVRDANSTIYLFGTLHIRRPNEQWGGPRAQAGLAEASEFWTEMDVSPATQAQMQGLIVRYGLAQPGRPLSSFFSEEENARISETARELGLPPEGLNMFQPWLAGLTIQIMQMMQGGFDAEAGADRMIDEWARANGKTPRWFETAEQQIQMMAGMSADVQRQMVLEAIDEADAGSEMMDRMATAWETGDLVTLERLVVRDMEREYPEMYQVLLVNRNNAWVETLHQELQGSGVDFVAVGMGHVIGDDGLVAQLRARGYSVERVE